MYKKQLLILLGFLLFFLFILFSYLVHKNHFTTLDFNTTVRLQDRIPRKFDDTFSALSDVGKVEMMTIVLIILLVICQKAIAGVLSFVLYVGFHLIEIYGKFFVSHPPPPEFMLRTKRIIDFPQFTVRLENSYPSGHAGRSLFLSVILISLIISNQKLTPIVKTLLVCVITCYNIVMLISRIYLGEHWTSDVIGGAVLGAGLGLISAGFLISNFKYQISNPKSKTLKN